MFYRKSEQDTKAFIVVIYVVDIDYDGKNSNETKNLKHRRHVDFTNIMPNFPKEGVIVASSDHTYQDHEHAIG